MKIILQGETPSKKNSRINTRSGRSFPNARYQKWHKAVVTELNNLLLIREIHVFTGCRVKLTASFFHESLRRRDSDNQLSSILDTLVDAGILEDDNWKIIPEKHIYDFYDKDNARVEIYIEEIQ